MGLKITTTKEKPTTDEVSVAHNRKTALENDIHASSKVKKILEDAIAEGEKRYLKIKTAIKDAEDDWEATHKEILIINEELVKAKKASTDQQAEHEGKISSLVVRADVASQGLQKMASLEQEIKQSLETLESKVKSKKQELEDAEAKLAERIKTYNEGEAHIIALNERKEASERATVKAERDCVDAQSRHTTVKIEADEHEGRIATAKTRLNEANTALAGVLSSKAKIDLELQETIKKTLEIKNGADEKLKVIAQAEAKLQQRVDYIKRLIEDGKTKGYLKSNFEA